LTRRKDGRIFFMAIVVFAFMAAVLILYIGSNNRMARHERYVTGDIVSKAIDDYKYANLWYLYGDYAVRFASHSALYTLPFNVSPKDCKSSLGTTLIKPDINCIPSNSSVRNVFWKDFNRSFMAYFSKSVMEFYNLAEYPEFPEHYSYYFFRGDTEKKLYVQSYEPMVISKKDDDVYFRTRAAYFSNIAFLPEEPIVDIYKKAVKIAANCQDSENYEQCLKEQLESYSNENEQWWLYEDFTKPEDLPESYNFLVFAELLYGCYNTNDTYCYCNLSLKPLKVLWFNFSRHCVAVNISSSDNYEDIEHQAIDTINFNLRPKETTDYILSKPTYIETVVCNFYGEGDRANTYYRKEIKFCHSSNDKVSAELTPYQFFTRSSVDLRYLYLGRYPIEGVNVSCVLTPDSMTLNEWWHKIKNKFIDSLQTKFEELEQRLREEHQEELENKDMTEEDLLKNISVEKTKLKNEELAAHHLDTDTPVKCTINKPFFVVVNSSYKVPLYEEHKSGAKQVKQKNLLFFFMFRKE